MSLQRDVTRWISRNIVAITAACFIIFIFIRQASYHNHRDQIDDDTLNQYVISKEETHSLQQNHHDNLRRPNSFGESRKASRPEYHWEDGGSSTKKKSHANTFIQTDLRRQYAQSARPLTEKEIMNMIRNLTFFKQHEVRKELEEQPYTYITKYQLGYSPQTLRILIKNVTETTFEELNKDYREIGSSSMSESSFSKFTSWFTGSADNNVQQMSIHNKKSKHDLLEERRLKIHNANRQNVDVIVAVISSDSFSHGNMVSHYQAAMDTLANYAKQQNYQFQIIDPQPIIDKYGTFIELLATELRHLKPGDRMKIHKSLVMLHTLRKRYYDSQHTRSHENSNMSNKFDGRRETWIVFLDADVMIANPQHRIEDIIHHTRVALRSSSCEVISQLSLSTINTGVMMFRISQISDILIQQWISLSVMGLIQSTDWQHEQGWFQYLYLLYLQRYFYSLHPFAYSEELDKTMSYEAMNCGFRIRKSHQHVGVRDVPLAVIRGRCFMKTLSILGALPIQYDMESSPIIATKSSKSVFSINKVQKELHMCMLTGLEMTNPFGSAISSIGFFNMHDWSGEDRFVSSATDGSYTFQLLDPRIGEVHATSGSSFDKNLIIDIEADGGTCGVTQPLFYHGKNETTRARLLKERDAQLLSRKTDVILRPVSGDGSCTRDLIHLLRTNADDKEWLSYGWQKKVQQIAEVKSQVDDIIAL